MKKLQTKEVEALFDAILALKTKEECYAFFEDACTVKEVLDVAQRLQTAKMLRKGESYTAIAEKTGMSSATISRVNRCLEYGCGGYDLVLARLKGEKENDGNEN